MSGRSGIRVAGPRHQTNHAADVAILWQLAAHGDPTLIAMTEEMSMLDLMPITCVFERCAGLIGESWYPMRPVAGDRHRVNLAAAPRHIR